MKAITISQPYASLIASGEKWVENRSQWQYSYRGLLAIHAGKGTQYLTPEQLRDYPAGHLIAISTLVDVRRLELLRQLSPGETWPRSGISVGDVLAHPYTEGPVCLILRGTVAIPPIACRGNVGLWDLPRAAQRLLDEYLQKWRLGSPSEQAEPT